MSPFSIREAGAQDVAGILAVQRQSEGAPDWNDAAWAMTFANEGPLRRVFVAVRDGALLGFGVASVILEIAELESIAVSPDDRRQHVGRCLCRALMAWGSEQGCAAMELEVRASNQGAQDFYRSMGFVEQGRRSKYYKSPEEDAVLMTAKLQA